MRALGNLLLLLVSLALSLLAAELTARIVFDPIDYLLPQLVDDDFLFYRIEGYSGGHDAWGFRNHQVPMSVDMVCIGDSMTYGINAQSRESWPAVLGNTAKTTVYNMSLGGYGPIQYLYLLRTKAVTLHPKIVIVGFYFGNDLWDVYNEVRFNKNWSEYGNFGGSEIKGPTLAHQRLLGGFRDWLSTHSLFYALLTRTPIWDFVRERELRRVTENESDSLIAYRDAKHNEIFDLSTSVRFLDMDDPRIKTAMQISNQVFLDMRSVAEKQGFRLIIALIPTKERVYAEILDRANYLHKYPRLADAVRQEDVARGEITGFLQHNNIEVLDLLPELEKDVERGDLYPRTNDHPNKDGYYVIAQTLKEYLSGYRVGGASGVVQ